MENMDEGRKIVEEFAEIIAPMSAEQRERVKDALAVVRFFSSGHISAEPDDKSSRSA